MARYQVLGAVRGLARRCSNTCLLLDWSVLLPNAEQVLALRLVPDTAPSLLKQEDDPQPYVDPEALERLFNPRGKYQ